MKIISNSSRMYIGGWLLAALLLMGANLSKVGQLQFKPLTENPTVVNTLRLKLYRFEQIMSEHRGDAELLWDKPVLLARSSIPPTPPRTPSAETEVAEAKTPNPLLWPQLSGILMAVTPGGQRLYTALLDGKAYSAKDRFLGFLIEEISSRGVWLSQHGQRRFIPAPEVYYSIDQTK
jgi:hypothetical protein